MIAAITIVVIMLVLLTVQGRSRNKKQTALPTGNITITATFYPLYIMLLNITNAVPGVKVTMLAPPETGCLHDYQLTTKDMEAVSDCNILVANGAGMEEFLDKILASRSATTIVAADGYELLNGNPHVWVSPEGAIYEVQTIVKGLARLDPKRADQYNINGLIYIGKIKELSSRMHAALDKYAGSAVITFHEAFPYFAAEFNLKPVAVIEREAGTTPNAKELAKIVTIIRTRQKAGEPVYLFAEEQYSPEAASIIAAETGLAVYELDPAVTGSPESDAYIKAMDQNTEVLEKAFSEGGLKK